MEFNMRDSILNENIVVSIIKQYYTGKDDATLERHKKRVTEANSTLQIKRAIFYIKEDMKNVKVALDGNDFANWFLGGKIRIDNVKPSDAKKALQKHYSILESLLKEAEHKQNSLGRR
jgi:hypothetical protein